ncbi:MAG: hypothetical protein ABFS39_11900 [Pseudomonadota bacterium]
MARLDTAQLLSSLQDLFYRMSHLSLSRRIDSYHGGGGGEMVKDISAPLSEHLEELARNATDDTKKPVTEGSVAPQALNETKTSTRSNHKRPRVQLLRERLNGLSRIFKRRGSSVVLQPHLSDQLQRSVRQHLNTSLRQARQGEIAKAKLHADLASNAMHELAHYMPKEDFTRFNTQISADLKEFRDRDIFKPLTELLD